MPPSQISLSRTTAGLIWKDDFSQNTASSYSGQATSSISVDTTNKRLQVTGTNTGGGTWQGYSWRCYRNTHNITGDVVFEGEIYLITGSDAWAGMEICVNPSAYKAYKSGFKHNASNERPLWGYQSANGGWNQWSYANDAELAASRWIYCRAKKSGN
ncbi:MAG: hypothetical protein QXJ15_04445, partial [Candidatus Bathyarchaeia archaeon]